MRESEFGQRVARTLRSQGAIVYSNVAGQYGEIGRPDKDVVHVRWRGFLELKGQHTKTGPKQVRVLRDLDARWPRHALQVRDLGGATVRVTRYASTGEKDDLEFDCGLEELLSRLALYSEPNA